MKVKELRAIMYDCWFKIVKVGEEIENDEILYDQTKTCDHIPNDIGEYEVSWACVDSPADNGDSVIFVAIEEGAD